MGRQHVWSGFKESYNIYAVRIPVPSVRAIQLKLVHTSCRFLTKLCDQVVALISDQHSEKLVFNSDTEHADVDFGDSDAVDDFDRLFHFEVQQTRQQEETATASIGFKVISMGHLKAISDFS